MSAILLSTGGVSYKAPGTLRRPACIQCCPSLGDHRKQPAIVFFPFTYNSLCFHLGLLVNSILPFTSGWLLWPHAISTEKQGALLCGIRDFSFSTAAPSVDKDFWHIFKDVAAELSTSVLSSICFYDISSILYCSLKLLLMTKDTLNLHLKKGSDSVVKPEQYLQKLSFSPTYSIE